jgi:hypothetical protein
LIPRGGVGSFGATQADTDKLKWKIRHRWVVVPVVLVAMCLAVWLWLMEKWGQFGDSLCGNRVVAEALSPNGRWKAVVFVRDCGATTSWATHVSILKPNAVLRGRDAGNVFHLDGGGPAGNPTLVTVGWDELNRLTIAYDKNYVVTYALNDKHDLIIFYRHFPDAPK